MTAAIARVSDPVGAHSGGRASWGLGGIILGALAGVALVAAFPVLVGVGVVGTGLLGAAVIGLGTASMVTGAAALGGKIGRYLGRGSGGGGGGGGPPCSTIADGSAKTIVEGKALARITDATTHNRAPLKSGAQKVLEQSKLVSRVGESATCGASRVLSGASKTFVGGPSADSGAPTQDPDEARVNSLIDLLDNISMVTGIAQIPLMVVGAIRTGMRVGLGHATEAAVATAAPQAARAGFRESVRQVAVQGASLGQRATGAVSAARAAATGAGQAVKSGAAAAGRAAYAPVRVAAEKIGQTGAGRAIAGAEQAARSAVANSPRAQAWIAGGREGGTELFTAASMYGAQTYGGEWATEQLISGTGMDPELADIVVQSTMFGLPTAWGIKTGPSPRSRQVDQAREHAQGVSDGVADARSGRWSDAIFGRDPAPDAAPSGSPSPSRGGDGGATSPAHGTDVEVGTLGGSAEPTRPQRGPEPRREDFPDEASYQNAYFDHAFADLAPPAGPTAGGNAGPEGGARPIIPDDFDFSGIAPPRADAPAPNIARAAREDAWVRETFPGRTSADLEAMQRSDPAGFAALQAQHPELKVFADDRRFEGLTQLPRNELFDQLDQIPGGERDYNEYLRRRMWREDSGGRPIAGDPGGPRRTTVDDMLGGPRAAPGTGGRDVQLPDGTTGRIYNRDDGGAFRSIDAYGPNGERLGSLPYSLSPDGTTASIGHMVVDPSMRSRVVDGERTSGLGSHLVDELVGANPNIARVKAVLTEDNGAAFYRASEAAGGDYAAGIQASPLYRALSKRGFGEVGSPPHDWRDAPMAPFDVGRSPRAAAASAETPLVLGGRGQVGGEVTMGAGGRAATGGNGPGSDCASCGTGGGAKGALPSSPAEALSAGSRAGDKSAWTSRSERDFRGSGDDPYGSRYISEADIIESARLTDVDKTMLNSVEEQLRRSQAQHLSKLVHEAEMERFMRDRGRMPQGREFLGLAKETGDPNSPTVQSPHVDASLRDKNKYFHLRDGWTEVQIHGDSKNHTFATTTGVGADGKPIYRNVTPGELAQLIKQHGAPDGPIMLTACEGGVGGPGSLAQELSNLTGRPVLASTGVVVDGIPKARAANINEAPTLIRGGKNETPMGRWQGFYPANDPYVPPAGQTRGESRKELLEGLITEREGGPPGTAPAPAPAKKPWLFEQVASVFRLGDDGAVGQGASAGGALPTTPRDFFRDATFTTKVDKGYSVPRNADGSPGGNYEAMAGDARALSREPGQYRISDLGRDQHALPHREIAAMAEGGHLDGAAVVDRIVGADGVEVVRLRMPTTFAMRGEPGTPREGFFEFIREPDGTINHALFRPNNAPGVAQQHQQLVEQLKLGGKGETSGTGAGVATVAGAAGGGTGTGNCVVCASSAAAGAGPSGTLGDPGLTFRASSATVEQLGSPKADAPEPPMAPKPKIGPLNGAPPTPLVTLPAKPPAEPPGMFARLKQFFTGGPPKGKVLPDDWSPTPRQQADAAKLGAKLDVREEPGPAVDRDLALRQATLAQEGTNPSGRREVPASIPEAHQQGYRDIADLLGDRDRFVARLQEFESRVEGARKFGDADPIDAVLRDMEKRHGFPPPTELREGVTDEQFGELLARGAPFRDYAFEGSVHGVDHHRVQWWTIAREMEVNPGKFGGLSAPELYQGMGEYVTPVRGRDGTYEHRPLAWTELFDSQSWDGPWAPEWIGYRAREGLLPGLGRGQ